MVQPTARLGQGPAGAVGGRDGPGAPPLAATRRELTPEWLTAALRSSDRLEPSVRVTQVHCRPIGSGQMSESLRLRLGFDRPSQCPPSLVAKLASSDPTSRATAQALGSYENEVRFYQQVAWRVGIRTPRLHYADIDPQAASFVLLLEDLGPARSGDQLRGCSPARARLALGELCRLHAPLWGDPSLEAVAWLHRDPGAQRALLLGLLPELWAGFRQRYRDRLGPEVARAGGVLFEHLDSYLSADTHPWTVVHGDYRLDNLLFAPGGRGLAVVDWQTCTHGPALQDVAYFVGAGLRAEVRRALEQELVAGYHAGLVDAGVQGYELERCWHDYRWFTWAGLVMAVAASMLVQRTERGAAMFMAMAHRHALHVLDLGADRLLAGGA